jgi:hypothetical protein
MRGGGPSDASRGNWESTGKQPGSTSGGQSVPPKRLPVPQPWIIQTVPDFRLPGLKQEDFGLGAPIVEANGKRTRTGVLRVVLSHSRKGYSEAVLRQDTETFLRVLASGTF